MSVYLMQSLPKDLLGMIDEFLLPSKEAVNILFRKVLSDLMFVFDDTFPIDEMLAFIKHGLQPPVLRRSGGCYHLDEASLEFRSSVSRL